jgi:hypothetical protein
VAIGSRREPDSVVVKQGTRNDRGKLFIYLWKRMVPVLGDIIDTQCGFKAFDPTAKATNLIYSEPTLKYLEALATSQENPLDQFLDPNPRR